MVEAQDKASAEKAPPAAAAKAATPAPASDAKPAKPEAKVEAAPAEAKATTPAVKAEQPESKAAEAKGEAAAPAKAGPPAPQDLRDNRWVKIVVIFAALVLPFVLGSYLSSVWRMPDYYGKITLLLLCLTVSLAITVMKWPPKLGIDLRGGVILVYEVQKDAGKEAEKQGDQPAAEQPKRGRSDAAAKLNMDKLIQAISRRINPGGVKEVTIRPQGENQLEIIIPEADEAETARIKSIISRAGTLEFRILANDRDHKSLIERAKASDQDKIRDSEGKVLAWWVPVTKGQEKSFASYGEIATRRKQIRG